MASNVLLTLNTERVHSSLKSKCSWTAKPNITFVFPSRCAQPVQHFYKVSEKIAVLQWSNSMKRLYSKTGENEGLSARNRQKRKAQIDLSESRSAAEWVSSSLSVFRLLHLIQCWNMHIAVYTPDQPQLQGWAVQTKREEQILDKASAAGGQNIHLNKEDVANIDETDGAVNTANRVEISVKIIIITKNQKCFKVHLF